MNQGEKPVTVNKPVDERLAPLMTAEGGFAIVALDQRESLREMFPAGPGNELVGDDALRDFKRTAAQVLTPHASGVLLDRPYAVTTAERPTWIAPTCGLLLAVDVLHSLRGAGVADTDLDEDVTPDFIKGTGATAIKLLIIWRRGQDKHVRTVQRFLELAAAAGVGTFVEGIVRPPVDTDWKSPADRHEAILEAAADLSPGASVYKAEVPGYVAGDVSGVLDQSRALTEVVDGPWVVLSNGVRQADFADAVTEACAGGSSGFLAGRAIWSDTVAEGDQRAALLDRAVPRLHALSDIVRTSRIDSQTAKGKL
jgi:sulfofructosephosphate aldolase